MKSEDIIQSAKKEIMDILHDQLGKAQDSVFPNFGMESHEIEGIIEYSNEKAFLVETKYVHGDETAYLKVELSLIK